MIGPAARDQDSPSGPCSLNKGPQGRGNSMKRPRCFPACIALIPKSWKRAVARFAHRYCGAPPGPSLSHALQITKGDVTFQVAFASRQGDGVPGAAETKRASARYPHSCGIAERATA